MNINILYLGNFYQKSDQGSGYDNVPKTRPITRNQQSSNLFKWYINIAK